VHEHADVAVLLHKIELWDRGPRFSRDRVLVAAGPLEIEDPNQASRLLSHAAATAVVSGDVRGTLPLARRALELASPDDPTSMIQCTATLGYLESHAADPGADARLAPIVELAELLVDSDDPEVVGLLSLVGMCLTETERLEEAERFLQAVVRRARREGAAASEALVAAILVEKALAHRRLAGGLAPCDQRRRRRCHDAREQGMDGGVPRAPRGRVRSG
jgi:hypothetical protein